MDAIQTAEFASSTSAKKQALTAVTAAKHAGKILLKHHEKIGSVKTKGHNWQELVTEADLSANSVISKILRKSFPEYAIFSEEGEHRDKGGYVWYVDPLDGTTNYVTHMPFWCTAIGLVKDGNPVLGVVYSPLLNELYTAKIGQGARMNGRPIHVSKNKELKKTVVNYCHPNLPNEIKKISKLYLRLKLESRDLRRFGSAGLDFCYLGAGHYDVLIHTNTRLAPWDFIAGYMIAKEAGAKITDWEGKPWTIKSKNLLATNGPLHRKMLKILKFKNKMKK